jgi:hypothetical protein
MVYGEIAPPQCALPSMASPQPPPQSTPLPPRFPSPTALTFHRWDRAVFCHILSSSIPPTALSLNPHLSDPAPRSPPNRVLSLCRPSRADARVDASTSAASSRSRRASAARRRCRGRRCRGRRSRTRAGTPPGGTAASREARRRPERQRSARGREEEGEDAEAKRKAEEAEARRKEDEEEGGRADCVLPGAVGE